jgi:hypothetical protein
MQNRVPSGSAIGVHRTCGTAAQDAASAAGSRAATLTAPSVTGGIVTARTAPGWRRRRPATWTTAASRRRSYSMSNTFRAVVPTMAWAFSTVVAANTASMALRV